MKNVPIFFVLVCSCALLSFSCAQTPVSTCTCQYIIEWNAGVSNTTTTIANCSWGAVQPNRTCDAADLVSLNTCNCGYGVSVACTEGQSNTLLVSVNDSYSNFAVIDECSYYETTHSDEILQQCAGCYDCVLTITKNGIVDTAGNPQTQTGQYDCTLFYNRYTCVHGGQSHIDSGGDCDCFEEVSSEGQCVAACNGLKEQNITVDFEAINNGECVTTQEVMCSVEPSDCNVEVCTECEVCEECDTCTPCATQSPCTEEECPVCPPKSECDENAKYYYIGSSLGGVAFGAGLVYLIKKIRKQKYTRLDDEQTST